MSLIFFSGTCLEIQSPRLQSGMKRTFGFSILRMILTAEDDVTQTSQIVLRSAVVLM